MKLLLRFLLFERPDRLSTTQLHPDIEVSDPPRFGYGETVNVGPGHTSPLDWPAYVVADIPHVKQAADPDQPWHRVLVFQVFLARKSDWALFVTPKYVRQLLNEGG